MRIAWPRLPVSEVLEQYGKWTKNLGVWSNEDVRFFCANMLREVSLEEAHSDCLAKFGEDRTPSIKALRQFLKDVTFCEALILVEKVGPKK